MTVKDQTGTARAADAPHWTSRWRASYRQGEWLVLSGPTSLVVMQPAAPQWSDLINAVWEDVLGSASLGQLATRMAEFRLDQMPDFAALFWDRDQMRSLVRGRVRLVDPNTGRSVATGEGVQTWTEVGLGDLQQVEVQAGDQTEPEQLDLPLVIGAVNASRVLLDCSDEMQIRSPQGTFVGNAEALDRLDAPAEPASSASPADADAAGAPAHAAEDDADRAETLVDQPAVAPDAEADDQPGTDRPETGSDGSDQPVADDREEDSDDGADDRSGPQHASPGAAAGAAGVIAAGTAAGAAGAAPPGPGIGGGSPFGAASAPSGPPSSGPSQPGPSYPSPSQAAPTQGPGSASDGGDDDGHTMVADSLPGLAARGRADEPPKRPVLGVLHPSSGGIVEIDRPVVIGRAPVASRVRSDQLPRLLTVPSPSHDISRTHVQIAPENGRLVVTDLNSTNGTILVLPDGRRTDLRPGVGVPADFGSVIDLGDGVTIAVDHG